jgi:hypothetical protein
MPEFKFIQRQMVSWPIDYRKPKILFAHSGKRRSECFVLIKSWIQFAVITAISWIGIKRWERTCIPKFISFLLRSAMSQFSCTLIYDCSILPLLHSTKAYFSVQRPWANTSFYGGILFRSAPMGE